MIEWIEYNIEHDPESVDLLLSRLPYNSLEDLEEAMDIIEVCEDYEHKLKNLNNAVNMVAKATLHLIQDSVTRADFLNS